MTKESTPATGIPARGISSRQVYWLLQIIGWGSVAAVHISAMVRLNRLSLSMTTGYVTASALAVLGTDRLRLLLHRRGWVHLSLPKLGARVMAGCIVIGLTIVVSAVSLERLLFAGTDLIPLTAGLLARIVVYWTVLLLGWSGCYLSLYFYRQSRQAERDRWKLEAMVRASELDVLRSQLDPHFMFNSLNSIRALISEDSSRAREVVTRLSAILRYTLQVSKAPTVPLHEELDVVRSYLDLESVRLEERLRYRIEIDDAARTAHVPPMMVQLLVENGIKHGISTRMQGGEVGIAAVARDGFLEIRIHNSGHLSEAPEAGGVGLQNARERLRLLYGDRAELSLKEDRPGVVVADLRLPLEIKDEGSHR